MRIKTGIHASGVRSQVIKIFLNSESYLLTPGRGRYFVFTGSIPLVCIGLLLFFSVVTCLGGDKSVEVIRIQYRNAEEVVPVVKDILSPEGTVAADPRTNSLVVADTQESIQKIKDFLTGYDKPVEQVKIRVKIDELQSFLDSSVSAIGSVSGGNGGISAGRPRREDGADVQLRDRRASGQQSSEYFINVASGSSAYISAGKDIPYRERWVYLCERYAHVLDTVSFQKIETGFEVRTVIMGDRANVEITPRISSVTSGEGPGVIRFAQASTSLTVPLNQWVTIGGGDQNSNEVIREILSYGSAGESSSLSISMMVEK